MCGSRGEIEVPDPPWNHKLYGFLQKLAFGPPWKKLDPPGKSLTPSETFEN